MIERRVFRSIPMAVPGMHAGCFQFRISDENGPTVIDFIRMLVNHMIMPTVWGSNEEREIHDRARDAIFGEHQDD